MKIFVCFCIIPLFLASCSWQKLDETTIDAAKESQAAEMFVFYNYVEGRPKYGYINQKGKVSKAGKVAIPFQFEVADEFSEGLAAVMIDNKFGYIDRTGKTVIPAQFHRAEKFEGGLALVTAKNFWKEKSGYINKTGDFVHHTSLY